MSVKKTPSDRKKEASPVIGLDVWRGNTGIWDGGRRIYFSQELWLLVRSRVMARLFDRGRRQSLVTIGTRLNLGRFHSRLGRRRSLLVHILHWVDKKCQETASSESCASILALFSSRYFSLICGRIFASILVAGMPKLEACEEATFLLHPPPPPDNYLPKHDVSNSL